MDACFLDHTHSIVTMPTLFLFKSGYDKQKAQYKLDMESYLALYTV